MPRTLPNTIVPDTFVAGTRQALDRREQTEIARVGDTRVRGEPARMQRGRVLNIRSSSAPNPALEELRTTRRRRGIQ